MIASLGVWNQKELDDDQNARLFPWKNESQGKKKRKQLSCTLPCTLMVREFLGGKHGTPASIWFAGDAILPNSLNYILCFSLHFNL